MSNDGYPTALPLQAVRRLEEIMDTASLVQLNKLVQVRDEVLGLDPRFIPQWANKWIDTCNADTLQEFLESERELLELAEDNGADLKFIKMCREIVCRLNEYEDQF